MNLREAFITLLFVVVSVWLGIVWAHSEEDSTRYSGCSGFAIMHPNFPCHSFLDLYPRKIKAPAVAVLWGTFGHKLRCLKHFTREFKDRPHLIEIHLSNEACRRNKRCHEGELLRPLGVRQYNHKLREGNEATRKAIQGRAKNILRTLPYIVNENTKILLTTGLEDNFTKEAYTQILEWVQEVWPYDVARNPLGRHGVFVGNANYLELHGLRPNFKGKPCITNNDGVKIDMPAAADKFYRRYATSCRVQLIWFARGQGIRGKEFLEPRSRVFEFDSKDDSLANVFLR